MVITKMAIPKINPLHYLVSESEGKKLAHCLDLDIVATATDDEEAERRLDLLVKYYLESALAHGNGAAMDTTAPASYWERYLDGTPLASRKLTIRTSRISPFDNPNHDIPVIAYCA